MESSNDNPCSQKLSNKVPREPSQLNVPVKKTIPATYPSSRLRNHCRFELCPENQTAAINGVSAIQHSQFWLNGGKQAAQSIPLKIAASQGQNRSDCCNVFTAPIRSDAIEHLFAANPRAVRVFLPLPT